MSLFVKHFCSQNDNVHTHGSATETATSAAVAAATTANTILLSMSHEHKVTQTPHRFRCQNLNHSLAQQYVDFLLLSTLCSTDKQTTCGVQWQLLIRIELQTKVPTERFVAGLGRVRDTHARGCICVLKLLF